MQKRCLLFTGGLLARGIIENITNHNVKNFISLSSPQGGQYGGKCSHIFIAHLVTYDRLVDR